MTDLKIKSRDNISDIEQEASRVSALSGGDIRVWITKNSDRRFFLEGRIASLLATVARRNKLRVVDWSYSPSDVDVLARFMQTLDGVAAVTYAEEIVTPKGSAVPYSRSEMLQRITINKGICEGKLGNPDQQIRSPSITICAFDSEMRTPLVFSGITDSRQFIDRFRRIRIANFETGAAVHYANRIGVEDDTNLCTFVQEIFQNTFRHGRYSKSNLIIEPAVRTIRMKRHIGTSRNDLSRRADGFSELQEYLEMITPPKGQALFWEVTVSDHGIGIIDRFVATRPEYGAEAHSREQKIELVNKIVTDALSSHRTMSGAGLGLRRALSAVDRLGGFVSIRTGDLWLFRKAREQGSSISRWLTPVGVSHDLAYTAGTQVSLLFPLS